MAQLNTFRYSSETSPEISFGSVVNWFLNASRWRSSRSWPISGGSCFRLFSSQFSVYRQ